MNNLLAQLNFQPKEGANNIYHKYYSGHNNYCIEVDFNQKKINYGNLITTQSTTTSNFSQDENWVVLECVNRLLEKGYTPQNIVLEKTYPSGHGHSGRLDICVNNDSGQEYLLIECKTYATFDTELNRTKRDGGQLFTYFKFENKATIIMLYASKLDNKSVVFRNEIIKIEDDYRTGSVKDFHERWNKITRDNGIFDDWVQPYNFISKALTPKQLVDITEVDSSLIFNQFLEILRHNVVSDKGNAFNKIFTLFLCKVYDEKSTKDNEELKFQWLEGTDDDISFQLRLADLYKNGMKDFLEKEVTDFSDADFNEQYGKLNNELKKSLKKTFTKLRLEKNNEFAIKEVFDHQSFKENARIVKEVVELLQKYKIRYNKRQQYLSDFFELLLTTGLKQESGQFFTPVPIAQFIIKSLPFNQLVDEKLKAGKQDKLMPFVMDYAAGSGHFLTESMHEMQRLLDSKNPKDYIEATAKKIRNWQDDHFEWAEKYVYGVEKDYRLVKVGKVGCYLHGDGLANVLLSDGLAKFKHLEYKDLLSKTDVDFPQDNKQFDVVISNPPYSVSSFKNTTAEYYSKDDFELYHSLTDTSSEIECLFVERAKQLLKDGGLAGIILPSSILSNTGIYSKTREILLQYFEIIAITELGKNTFMATGTNTVVLFLKRKNNYDSIHLKESVAQFFSNPQDITLNGIENVISKYLNYAWEGVSFEDYKTLLQKIPNETIQQHELYQDYQKIKAKNKQEKWQKILQLEQEKIFYFILTYLQKIVLIKTGEKKAEKQFLGYEFSNRRGSEGIHPIQRGKSIDECTQLFDVDIFDNPKKASTYIYQAFNGDLESEIDDSLKNNISRVNLVDLMNFDRADFEKTVSLSVKKKLKIESQWNSEKLELLLKTLESGKRPRGGVNEYQTGIPSLGGEHVGLDGKVKVSSDNIKFVPENYYNQSKQGKLQNLDILICKDGALTGKTALFKSSEITHSQGIVNEHVFLLRANEKILQNFLFNILYSFSGQEILKSNITGQAQGGLNRTNLLNIKIPVPPKKIQQKIIDGIEVLEQQTQKTINEIRQQKEQIFSIIRSITTNGKIANICTITNRKKNPQNFQNEQFNYIGLENIEKNTGNFVNIPTVNGGEILSVKNVFSPNNVLYGKLRPYLNKVAVADFYGICSTDILVLDTHIPVILKYILLSEDFLNQASNQMTGIDKPRIKPEAFKNIVIPIPATDEQQEIVKKIEKIEIEINKLETQLKAIPVQKQAIFKKYL